MNLYRTFPRLTVAALLMSASLPSRAETMQDITLRFAGEFDGRTADCNTDYDNIGAKGTTVGIADFRLYVSRISVLDEGGNRVPVTLTEHGPWQHGDVALLDFEDGSGHCANGTSPTNHVIKGQVPQGDYHGVAFDIGVPFDSNHQDPTLAASPLNLTAMFWNWRGGYRFMRLDLLPDVEVVSGYPIDPPGSVSSKHESATQTSVSKGAGHAMDKGQKAPRSTGWAVHLGSTSCKAASPTSTPESCASPNRVEVMFEQADPSASVFVIDPAAILNNSDLTHNTEGTSPGCMSAPNDPECAAIMEALGLHSGNASQALVSVR
ncbi:MbnP family copper-binding protein [Granulosicoccus sp. 3-233]|uniref:MbnP family copper-binding protein n=1 Tax=Granulosicoccus sp. 3-233 TaxID=3417969 RepID=UPI003D33BADA